MGGRQGRAEEEGEEKEGEDAPEALPKGAGEGAPSASGEEAREEEGAAGRPWCSGCERARRICVCAALPSERPLASRSRIVILIHPKEVQRALGTAPLLKLCLSNLIVKVGDRFPEPEEDPEFHERLVEGGRRCYLVCPGPGAEELRPPSRTPALAARAEEEEEEDKAAAAGRARRAKGQAEEKEEEEEEGAGPPRTLIFIDGRWPQAKGMVNRSAWLRESLPRVVLVPEEQSGYVFRKQPEEGCLSTLEAVAEALLALEGSRGPALKAALVAPFRLMVELQCGFIPEAQDKNARLKDAKSKAKKGREAPRLDAQAVLKLANETSAVDAVASEAAAWAELPEEERALGPDGRPRQPGVHCIVKWGEKGVAGRQVVVVQVLRAPLDMVKSRARELSAGQARGRRFWVLPPDKLPPNARYEAVEEEEAEAGEDDGQQ